LAITPLDCDGHRVLTLRQLDRLNNVAKGTTFRAFKRSREQLVEGEDFLLLDASSHRAWIEDLRRRGLIYPATVQLLLLTESGYQRLQAVGQADWQ